MYVSLSCHPFSLDCFIWIEFWVHYWLRSLVICSSWGYYLVWVEPFLMLPALFCTLKMLYFSHKNHYVYKTPIESTCCLLSNNTLVDVWVQKLTPSQPISLVTLPLGWEFRFWFQFLISGTPIGAGISIPFSIPKVPVGFFFEFRCWKIEKSEFRVQNSEFQKK